MTEYEAFCRAEAARRGIDPEIAVEVASSEGGLSEAARRGTFDTGSSWWAYQLHYGGAGYEQLGPVAGMGNSFTALTGWAPGDPAAWRDAMRFALDRARSGGWGPWYGAKARGIAGFRGIDVSVPWGGTPAGEWDFRQGAATVTDTSAVLARVLELARAEIGKPYSGPVVGQPDSARYGNPGYDCSSFVSEMYKRATGGAIKLTPFTDAAYAQTEWAQTPQPGSIVFYNYDDDSQPGVMWPHMGLWLSTTEVLDCRVGQGVGIHPHVTPVDDGKGRWRRTMLPKGLATVTLPDVPTKPDPRDERIGGLRTALYQVLDVLVPQALEAGAKRDAVLAEAARIKAEQLG